MIAINKQPLLDYIADVETEVKGFETAPIHNEEYISNFNRKNKALEILEALKNYVEEG